MTTSSLTPSGKDVLSQLKTLHGGKCLSPIRKKLRWKAPWPMSQGNTVTLIEHQDGSQTISATGKAALVVRDILGTEDQSKILGTSGTVYAIWQFNAPE